MKNPLQKFQIFSPVQFIALAIIIAMAASDFTTLFWLFREMISPDEALVYSLILTGGLEGLPFFLGMIHSEKHDTGSYQTNDKKVASVGFWISLLAYFLVYAITVMVRLAWIDQMKRTMREDRFQEEVISQYFLILMPLATSLLAYVASWFAFRSSALERQYKIVVRKQAIYTQCQENFQNSLDAYQRARFSLWASLTDSDPIPPSFNQFRKDCFAKIRAKLVANCVTCYPTQIERYTQMVNKELERLILEAAEHSTLPQAITSLTLSELIEEHDAKAMDYADCWDYNYAGPDLEAELRSTLDNAIVVAQFETVIRHNNKI